MLEIKELRVYVLNDPSVVFSFFKKLSINLFHLYEALQKFPRLWKLLKIFIKHLGLIFVFLGMIIVKIIFLDFFFFLIFLLRIVGICIFNYLLKTFNRLQATLFYNLFSDCLRGWFRWRGRRKQFIFIFWINWYYFTKCIFTIIKIPVFFVYHRLAYFNARYYFILPFFWRLRKWIIFQILFQLVVIFHLLFMLSFSLLNLLLI